MEYKNVTLQQPPVRQTGEQCTATKKQQVAVDTEALFWPKVTSTILPGI